MALKPAAALRKDQTNAGSSMEHRHFATVAAIIKGMRRVGDSTSNFDADHVAHHFADELAPTNPRFDRARFLKACGL